MSKLPGAGPVKLAIIGLIIVALSVLSEVAWILGYGILMLSFVWYATNIYESGYRELSKLLIIVPSVPMIVLSRIEYMDNGISVIIGLLALIVVSYLVWSGILWIVSKVRNHHDFLPPGMAWVCGIMVALTLANIIFILL